MQCLRCQTDNSPQAKFCLGCGARLAVDDAREHLTTATAVYRVIGMAFWLEKAEAAWGALR
jgi:ribosomal protein L40E